MSQGFNLFYFVLLTMHFILTTVIILITKSINISIYKNGSSYVAEGRGNKMFKSKNFF